MALIIFKIKMFKLIKIYFHRVLCQQKGLYHKNYGQIYFNSYF